MNRNAFSFLLGLALVALPRLAAACPVCNAYGEEESRAAFILTTVFLSGLPVAMIGVGAWFIWRGMRASERTPRRNPAATAGRVAALPRQSPVA